MKVYEDLNEQSKSEPEIEERSFLSYGVTGFTEDKRSDEIETSDLTSDQDNFFSNLFTKSSFKDEKWEDYYYVDGRVSEIANGIAYVECLMDEDSMVFKEKVFPLNLLSHIKNLSENKFLRVKMSYKAGSIRYDIYDGDSLSIDKEAFESEDIWDELDDFEFDDYS